MCVVLLKTWLCTASCVMFRSLPGVNGRSLLGVNDRSLLGVNDKSLSGVNDIIAWRE